MNKPRTQEQIDADNLEIAKAARTKICDLHGAQGIVTTPVDFNVILEIGKVQRCKNENDYSLAFFESKKRQQIVKVDCQLRESDLPLLQNHQQIFISQTSDLYPAVKAAITEGLVVAIKADIQEHFPKLELVEIITDPCFVARVKDSKYYYTVPYRLNIGKGEGSCFCFNLRYEKTPVVRFSGFYEAAMFPENEVLLTRLKACIDYELSNNRTMENLNNQETRELLYAATEAAVLGKPHECQYVKANFQKI